MSQRNWTASQKLAIETTGSSLLVSAAAGSGKTAVLTARCLHLMLDKNNPCPLSRMLVVTFTESAAEEMRHRISQQLQKIAPTNAFAARQLAELPSAPIQTIDSFCNRLVRSHASLAGVPINFSVIDPAQANVLLRQSAMAAIQSHYISPHARQLSSMIDGLVNESTDQLVSAVVRLHHFTASLARPDLWLQAIESDIAAPPDQLVSPAVAQLILQHVQGLCSDHLEIAHELLRLATDAGATPVIKWTQLLIGMLESAVTACQTKNLAQLLAIAPSDPGRLSPLKRGVKHYEAIMIYRHVLTLPAKTGPISPELRTALQLPKHLVEDARRSSAVLVSLLDQTRKIYTRLKAGALDFADVARAAAQLLSTPDGSPSEVAKDCRNRFRHVLVDEYQDTNELQESILTRVATTATHPFSVAQANTQSENSNLFVVGDIKQSIYRFRHAEPSLFMNRAEHYKSHPNQGRVIHLQENFRSRSRLIHGINTIFEKLMTQETEIIYDHTHALKPGLHYPPLASPGVAETTIAGFEEAQIELHLSLDQANGSGSESTDDAKDNAKSESDAEGADDSNEQDDFTRIERQAALTASIIHDLLKPDAATGQPSTHVLDAGTYRPIRPSDITILLRSLQGKSATVATVLRKAGISVAAAPRGGLLAAPDVRDLHALLQAIDHPHEDIPLATALTSPLMFDPDAAAPVDPYLALAAVRAVTQESKEKPLYEAILAFIALPVESLPQEYQQYQSLLASCIDRLSEFRKLCRSDGVISLIEELFAITRPRLLASVKPDAAQRLADLDEFRNFILLQAQQGQSTLPEMLHLLSNLAEDDKLDRRPPDSASHQAVRLMSIHAAKGLEFPVVFVLNMEKRFNTTDIHSSIVYHPKLGLAACAVDQPRRLRFDTPNGHFIKNSLLSANTAEEIRVLYVALTRPREKLYLIGSAKKSQMDQWSSAPVLSPNLALNKVNPANSWLELIAPLFVPQLDKNDPTHPLSIYLHPSVPVLSVRSSHVISTPESAHQRQSDTTNAVSLLSHLPQPYEHAAATRLPSALSVTHLVKPASIGAQGTSKPAEQPVTQSQHPTGSDLSADDAAAALGTATHLLLQHIDFSLVHTADTLRKTVDTLVQRKLVQPDIAAAIDLPSVLWLLSTPPFAHVPASANSGLSIFHRELPLYFTASSDAVSPPSPADLTMIRGRIDLLIQSPPPASEASQYSQVLNIIDYKTDRVSKYNVHSRHELYSQQVALYAQALRKIDPRALILGHVAYLTPRLLLPVIVS